MTRSSILVFAGVGVLHIQGRKRGDVGIAFEIVFIESQDMRNAVDVHHGNGSRIVDQNAPDGMSHDQPAPFLMRCQAFGQELAIALDRTRLAFGFLRAQAVAAARGSGPRADGPEFGQNLSRVVKRFLFCPELPKRIQNGLAIWIVFRDEPKKDVRIDKKRHSVYGEIDILAREVAGQRRDISGH